MPPKGKKSRKFTAENPYDKGDRSFHFRGKREELSTGFDRETDLDVVKRDIDLDKLHAEVDKKKPSGGEEVADTKDKGKEKEKGGKEVFGGVLDIFGNLETQEYYVNAIREILETPDFGDRLHDFIMANKTYQKSTYHRLNSDWREKLGFNPDGKYEGRNLNHTNMRIAAASQLLMIEYYKARVFEMEKKVDLNPWRFADGKTGAYTVSVYSEYWKSRHSANSNRKKPNRTDLAAGYGAEESFDNAMTQLNIELQNSDTVPTPKRASEEDEDKQDPAAKLAANL